MPETERSTPVTYQAIGPRRVHSGPDCLRGLPGAVLRAGGQRALILSGTTIAEQTGLLWYVEQVLGPLHAGSFSGVRAHTPAASVQEAAEMVGMAAADVLISLGGGSAIDTAKAVAHALAEEGAKPFLPHIALPTTLSAAEFTFYAGVTGADGVKRSVRHEELAPREVFLDPRLTLATPRELWLASGIKALDHAVESFLNRRHHPITDTLAVEAARRLFTHLPACAADLSALAPRGEAQIGAWMSLFSPATTRGGLSHALGHQLGARGVPHGVTSCITLAPVLRLLAPVNGERQAAMAEVLGLDAPLADAVQRVVAELGLPSRLRDTSLDRTLLPALAEAAWEEAAPVSLGVLNGPADLLALLESMW